ncbi:Alpha/Beta hydrolase protein [Collybia nuda]|uniref:Dipeptidyl-peptidase V n=1 Tax=Collybia nuda TaxID=64659 RepID=A0A9P5YEI3_9AGAR|nr:Alpha/Beta hydrolase protein [Collybia nuda]
MRFPFTFLGLTAQVPFLTVNPPHHSAPLSMTTKSAFKFKEGPDVFSPKNLVELKRPGTGVANDAGDLVLVPVSKFSFEDKKNKKFIYVAPLESTVQPLEIPLDKGGETFWINSRTVAHVVEGDDVLELYALDIKFEAQAGGQASSLTIPAPPTLIGKFPSKSATNFRFSPASGQLVFSAYVYPDGNLTAVKKHDDEWESRGNSAFVYDTTYVRHWDTWQGAKRPALFSVRLTQDPGREWMFGPHFINLLEGTGHSSPVEPFGGTDDFDVSKTHVVYTTKDPKLPEAWHTKQNVYMVDIHGGFHKELTSGKQGAIHSPVFSADGGKVAWLELDEDGYESDRAKIVIYDLHKDIRFTLTQDWDRSPDALTFSKEGNFIYFTAGDEAKVKIFVLPIPPTPSESSTNPKLSSKYRTPVVLVGNKAASGIQALFTGRLLFTQSSLTSPNDVFIIRNLQRFEEELSNSDVPLTFEGKAEQITHFTEAELKGKALSEGEEFWFKGANDRDVQGWVLKPRGWKHNQQRKYPVLLLIHGGPQGAWEDQWSNRWNPNVFAQQGYFVIMINPTGSTTFGQEFTDAIAEDWGGKPFVDMQAGWKFALHAYPEINPERAVAAGASWGGYAINWIQGHPEYGFNFKALVGHDGVFDSNYNGYSTDELFFFNHEWGGRLVIMFVLLLVLIMARPWEEKSKALSRKFSPSNFVNKWSTPQLLIHGSKDYRLPETESIAAFHALQQRGVRSRLVIFPDENHWVLNHGNSLKWHIEVLRWFDEFVGEEP